jgi:ankyrin repeat protein
VRLALEARNHKGDTPLHCAAGAGNAQMISCLVDLIAYTTDDDEAGVAAKKTFLRVQNECGETTLHQAIRAANNKVACIDQLMVVDPELACIPCDDAQ